MLKRPDVVVELCFGFLIFEALAARQFCAQKPVQNRVNTGI